MYERKQKGDENCLPEEFSTDEENEGNDDDKEGKWWKNWYGESDASSDSGG